MTYDLTVILQDKPGTLADVGEALGNAGINIDGLCGFPCEGKGVLHVLVEEGDAARTALEVSGQHVEEMQEVLVVEMVDEPGEFGRVCRLVANAGVNLNLSYTATQTRLVLGADDLDKARAAIG